MRTIILDGNAFSDMEGFYCEIDRLLTKDLTWKTGHNLHAFNDILRGGFGEGFSAMNRDAKYDILNIAIPNRFVEHGDIPSLRKECGIDAESICSRVRNHLEQK